MDIFTRVGKTAKACGFGFEQNEERIFRCTCGAEKDDCVDCMKAFINDAEKIIKALADIGEGYTDCAYVVVPMNPIVNKAISMANPASF